MKTDSEFEALYERSILPVLKRLEGERKKALFLVIVAGIFIFAAASAGAYFIYTNSKAGYMSLMPFFPAAVAMAWAHKKLTRGYRYAFKHFVVKKIINQIDESLKFSMNGSIRESTFTKSRIFLSRVDRYDGEDHVSGIVGQTTIEFSEVHAQHKSESKDREGKVEEKWSTIFKGLFFVAEFNKHLNGLTILVPDVAERFLGKLVGQSLQKLYSDREGMMIKLEDPEFERFFRVYASDQVEARYVLTPSLMRRIVDFRKMTGLQTFYSFHGSHVYMALKTNKNMFEPRVFRSAVDYEATEALYNDFRMFIDIVEELDLNTRIWTKE